MSWFREAVEWVRESVTAARVAYVIGFAVSGGVGHCVAVANVAPRIDAVEARLAKLRAEAEAELAALGADVARNQRVMDRVEGMVEGVALALGVSVPPPVLAPVSSSGSALGPLFSED